MRTEPVYVRMTEGAVYSTVDTGKGVIIDFDIDGNTIGVEVLDAIAVTVGGESVPFPRAGNPASSTESEKAMIPDENPHPIQVQICDKCGVNWNKHRAMAERHYYDDEGEEHFEERQVTLLDCIHLLKLANQGPMGPPGYQGAKGDTGKDGKDAGQDGTFRYIDDPK